MIFAGVRPGSRFTFVSTKVNKTIDALFGLIKLVGRNYRRVGKLASLKQCPFEIRTSIQGAEQQASDEGTREKWKFHVANIAWLGLWCTTPFSQQRLEDRSTVAQDLTDKTR